MAATMTGKTVLITGGTSGIGREAAIGIAKLGAHVVVTGRNESRGQEGVADIKTRSGNNNIELLLADFASFAEIRRLAAAFQQQFERLDVLVNNVGLLPTERYETVDGIEATLAINHLAPFLLTHELLPILQASAPSRVLNVTGGTTSGSIDFDNLQAEQSFLSLETYSHAKRVMMAASYEFARRLEGTGVTLNVVYPGAANTNMTKDMTPDMVPFMVRLMWPVFRLVMGNADPANAAVSTIKGASEAQYEGQSATFYNTKGKPIDWSPDIITGDIPQRIWDMSVEMTGIQSPVTA